MPSVFPWTSVKTHEVERKKRCIARKRKFEKSCDIKSNDEQSQDPTISSVGNGVETSTCESDGQSVKCSESEPPSAIYY